jgi:hypothetical protein
MIASESSPTKMLAATPVFSKISLVEGKRRVANSACRRWAEDVTKLNGSNPLRHRKHYASSVGGALAPPRGKKLTVAWHRRKNLPMSVLANSSYSGSEEKNCAQLIMLTLHKINAFCSANFT